ncbi:hypothetical protein BSKO_09380 [Bryopsis sp. KO-2023]|nr:hypothetical protein BSKO_09380 [Bryopsis sp. KO-2023]
MISMQNYAPPSLVHAVSLAFDQPPKRSGQPPPEHNETSLGGGGMEARSFYAVGRPEQPPESDSLERIASFGTHTHGGLAPLRPREDDRFQEPPRTGHSIESTRQHKELDPNDTIKVAVRVRPLLDYEKVGGAQETIQIDPADPTSLKVVLQGPLGSTLCRDFHFHACLGQNESQEEVLEQCSIRQLIDAALAGYNVTIMAYGQTGSGKTYTMSGREVFNDHGVPECKDQGVIMGAVQHLINAIPNREGIKCGLKASYLEIYNEGVYDLTHQRNRSLPVKWDARRGFHVPGLKVVDCSDMRSLDQVIATGIRNRRVGSHELNMESSRSHTILTIYCDSTPTDPSIPGFGSTKFGKVSFVDLAGSERLKDSRSSGDVLKETTNINKSLFNLGKVISTLAERESAPGLVTHVPYRESVLTKLLMDSLGGSAFALMIACCSPAPAQIEETLSTLSYATRAKRIVNCPTIQYDPDEVEVIALRSEVELLREENVHLRGIIRGQDHSKLDPPEIEISPQQVPVRRWSNDVSPAFGPNMANPLVKPPLAVRPSSNLSKGGLRRAGSAPSMKFPQPFECTQLHNQGRGSSIHDGDMSSQVENARASMLSQQPKDEVPLTPAESRGQRRARLMDTHDILTQFTEENGRLARENERLRSSGERMLNSSQVLFEEITLLKNKLSQLESAVLSGGDCQVSPAMKAPAQYATSQGGFVAAGDMASRRGSSIRDENDHQPWLQSRPGMNCNNSTTWPNQDWVSPSPAPSQNPTHHISHTAIETGCTAQGRSSRPGSHRASPCDVDGNVGGATPSRVQDQIPMGGRRVSGQGSPVPTSRPSSTFRPENVSYNPKKQAPHQVNSEYPNSSNPGSEPAKEQHIERLISNSRASSACGQSTRSNAGASSVGSPGRRASRSKPKAPDEGVIVADKEGLSLLFGSKKPNPKSHPPESINRQPQQEGYPTWLASSESVSSQQQKAPHQGPYIFIDPQVPHPPLGNCSLPVDHHYNSPQPYGLTANSFHRVESWDGSSYASQLSAQKSDFGHRRNTEPAVMGGVDRERRYGGGGGGGGAPLPFGVGPPGYAARYQSSTTGGWGGNLSHPGGN